MLHALILGIILLFISMGLDGPDDSNDLNP